MPKGGSVDEATFRKLDKKLRENYGLINETAKETGWGIKTISMVKKAKGSHEKFLELRAESTEKRRQKGYKPKQSSTFQTPEQDIHDLLREAQCIKSMMSRLLESLGVM